MNTKISDLSADGSISGTEEIPSAQGGSNAKITINQIIAFAKAQIGLEDIITGVNKNKTGAIKIIADYVTASRIAIFNAQKELVAYANAITLAHLEGTSGVIQTQIDNLVDAVNSLSTAVTDLTNYVVKLPIKLNCRAASTTNINIASPPSSFDGVTMAEGERVLIKNQSSNTENGIYIYHAAGLAVPSDFAPPYKVAGCVVYIEEGSTQADTGYICTSDEVWTPGLPVVFAAL